MLSSVFIVGAKRTPFGTFGGGLKSVSATKLGVVATKAALQQANLDASLVDQVFFGNVIPSSSDAAYLARHVALQSGMKIETPSLTLNRLCGSGFETVIQGALNIQVNQGTHIAVCGGAENMSLAPLQVFGDKSRWGVGLGQGMMLSDALWDGLTDAHAKTPMGITAENLAKDYGITRAVSNIQSERESV
jgi:acetyl-CoA acyltransferase 2